MLIFEYINKLFFYKYPRIEHLSMETSEEVFQNTPPIGFSQWEQVKGKYFFTLTYGWCSLCSSK